MKKSTTILCIILSFIAIGLIQDACIPDHTYQGKVIDAETLKPVEGALVIALWTKERFVGMLTNCTVKDAKEILTDKNGAWSITGTEGNNTKIGIFFQYFGFYRTEDPRFEIYKPGLTGRTEYGNFTAYPYVGKDGDLVGIILRKPGNSVEEARKYFEKYSMMLPFIPIDNPEKRLRELNFSFEYPAKTATLNEVWCMNNNIKPYWLYTIVGLRKAKTRKERVNAMDFTLAGGCYYPEKIYLPLKTKMKSKERELLFGHSGGR